MDRDKLKAAKLALYVQFFKLPVDEFTDNEAEIFASLAVDPDIQSVLEKVIIREKLRRLG